MTTRLFNKVLFEVKDVVQSKHPEDRIHGVVEEEEIVENSEGFAYQLIMIFGSWYSAFDFEPLDKTERKHYYAEYAKYGYKAMRTDAKLNLKKAKTSKVKSFNLNKIKKKDK